MSQPKPTMDRSIYTLKRVGQHLLRAAYAKQIACHFGVLLHNCARDMKTVCAHY